MSLHRGLQPDLPFTAVVTFERQRAMYVAAEAVHYRVFANKPPHTSSDGGSDVRTDSFH